MLGFLQVAAISIPLLLNGATSTDATDHGVRGDGEARAEYERVIGVVQSESGHTLQVRTPTGEVDVHWSAETRCEVAGHGADCDAIAPGHQILAVGQFSGGSSQFQADRIVARRHTAEERERIRGAVTAVAGQEFTVETPSRGLIAVVWTDETQCRPGPCAEIAVGDHLGAVGQLAGSTLTAARIVVAPDASQRPHVAGRVESATGHVLHVVTRSGETVNVHWDADTACAPVDCDAIPPGALILAVGEELGGPNFDASQIRIRLHVARSGNPV